MNAHTEHTLRIVTLPRYMPLFLRCKYLWKKFDVISFQVEVDGLSITTSERVIGQLDYLFQCLGGQRVPFHVSYGLHRAHLSWGDFRGAVLHADTLRNTLAALCRKALFTQIRADTGRESHEHFAIRDITLEPPSSHNPRGFRRNLVALQNECRVHLASIERGLPLAGGIQLANEYKQIGRPLEFIAWTGLVEFIAAAVKLLLKYQMETKTPKYHGMYASDVCLLAEAYTDFWRIRGHLFEEWAPDVEEVILSLPRISFAPAEGWDVNEYIKQRQARAALRPDRPVRFSEIENGN
jgi:hypothetical protein